MTTARLLRLALAALLFAACPPDSEAMTVKCDHTPCSGSITLTGTVVSSLALNATARDGVLVAEWSCSGSSECGIDRDRTAIALYDAGVQAIVLTVDPGAQDAIRERHVGGTLAWVGEASVRLASAGGWR